MPKWELKCITQRNNIICWHHRSEASQKSSIPAQQIQRTGVRKRACRGETGRSVSTKHEHVHSRTQQHRVHTQPGQHHHPGIFSAQAPRHSKLCRPTREWASEKRNGPNPTPRSTRTHRKITQAASPSRSEAPSKMEAHLGFLSRRRSSRRLHTELGGCDGGRFHRPVVKFASSTALAHPRGVADRMFLVRCDLPPSPAAWGA